MSTLVHLYTVQELPAGKLSIMPHPRGGDWLSDDVETLALQKVDLLISLLTPDEVVELNLQAEAETCQGRNMRYISHPIVDLNVPPFAAETFVFLEELQEYLAQNRHIVIHCWMGLGRSPLVAASVLILCGFPPAHACALLSAVRGHQVPETAEQRAWVEALPQRYAEYRNTRVILP